MTEDQLQFHSYLRNALADHPAWLETALGGIAQGMQIAFRRAEERAEAADLAMRSALALADPARLTAETKAILGQSICNHISSYPAHCEIERKTLERLS